MDISINVFVANINFNKYISYFQDPSNDFKTLFHICEKHANAGNGQALVNLGWLYKNGFGTVKDYQKAMANFLKAYDKKNINAAYNIGRLYHKGYGLEKNYDLAKSWYLKGIDNPIAMKNLADLLYESTTNYNIEGGPLYWYGKASESGNSWAMFSMAKFYLANNKRNSAINWLLKASKLNNADAIQELENLKKNDADNVTISI